MTTTSLQTRQAHDLGTAMTPEVFEMFRRTRPASRQDLSNYVKVFLGIDVPRPAHLPGHSSPMDDLWPSLSTDRATEQRRARSSQVVRPRTTFPISQRTGPAFFDLSWRDGRLWGSQVGSRKGMNYQFDKEKISQHVVKYGVDVRPPISPDEDRTKLQDYANWLVQQFPRRSRRCCRGRASCGCNGRFSCRTQAGGAAHVHPDRPGPVFTFPERLYIDRPHELSITDRDKVFRKAYDELRARFPDHTVPRVGVIHELVFDTGNLSSLDVIAGCLKHDRWRHQAQNLRIQIESLIDGKSMNIGSGHLPAALGPGGSPRAPGGPQVRHHRQRGCQQSADARRHDPGRDQ